MTARALTYFEIDVPFCSLTYSIAPCQATLTGSPPTGTIKCFNSIRTCQDRVNFTDGGATLRFAIDTDYLPAEIDAIPSMISLTLTPATVSLGVDLGKRATLEVKFRDHPHSDTGQGFDKYLAERTYNPFRLGTFWGKFVARHRSLQGRDCRVIRGLLGQSLAEMETRHYVVESFDGPSDDGTFTISAKDVLKFADGDRAQAPVLSNGFLSADITAVATSATLLPAGIGNAEYPASGFVCISGKEICSFTRAADVLTITRGQLGTVATTHTAQDRVQLVLRYVAADPAVIVRDLFVTYAGVDTSLIPVAAWQIETAAFNGSVYGATIPEPTSVSQLISELVEQAALAIGWDDRNEQIKLQVLHGIPTTANRYNEDNVLEDSLKITAQPDQRISQVWVYFGQIDPTSRLDNVDNYRSTAVVRDAQAEDDYNAVLIKKIFSRWIAAGGRSVATRLADIQLGRRRDPPRRFSFDLPRDGGIDPVLMAGYRLGGGDPFRRSWPFQDETGDRVDVPIQITRVKPSADRFLCEAEEMLFTADANPALRTIILDTDTNNVNLRTLHDSLFAAPVGGSPGETVTCVVQEGVIVGSVINSLPAFDVGTWPTGVIVNLTVIGRIEGTGGQGAPGNKFGFGGDGGPSIDGGTALFLRRAVNLDVAAGEIFGGGGGGAGSGSYGGGGGAGRVSGAAGFSELEPTREAAPGTDNAGGLGATGSTGGFKEAGPGGGPGLTGGLPVTGPTTTGPGDAGIAIDGISFVTVVGGPGDIRGARVN
jgi:hypothetical protein